MIRDKFKSLAVIPNPTDDFSEIYATVERQNGRTIERMVRRLKETDCGGVNVLLDEQVFMDSAVSFGEGKLITQIVATTDLQYTITSPSHGYSNGQSIVLRNVSGANALYLNGTKWTIGNVTTDTFDLITEII
jgi:hypothetical protein